MIRDTSAEVKASAELEYTAFPAMTYYTIMHLNPVAWLKDLSLDEDLDIMNEAAKLQKRLSNHLVYVVVSFHNVYSYMRLSPTTLY